MISAPQLEEVTAERDSLMESAGAGEAELAEREAELEAQAAELDRRAAELDERETAIQETEIKVEQGTIPGDGIFLVGTDIQPYRSNAADWYWARLVGTSGELDDIVANGNGAAVVTIESADVAFESRFCESWALVQ